MSVAWDIVKRASHHGLKITTAESCTGGMVAAAITDIPGSSAIFEYGFVTYSNQAKSNLIGVPSEIIAKYGAVSEPVVQAMALGAAHVSGADIAVSVSGIAGPGGSEHKPEGRVCFAIAQAGICKTETVEFGAIGRKNVRQAATDHALQLILADLSKHNN